MNKRNTGLRRMATYLPLAALALVGATTLAQPQAAQNGELVALCQRGEAAVPQSCGCTVDRARQAAVADADLRSLLTDDGKRRPVAQSTYSRFWQLKIECISEAAMAGLPRPAGGTQAAALPPPVAPPVAPGSAQTRIAAEAGPRTPIPVTDARPTDPDRVFYFTPDQVRAILAALEGTTWQRTFEDGSTATYEFGPDRALVQRGRNYVERNRLVVSDEPGFRRDFPGIKTDAAGRFTFAGTPRQPYLALQNESGRQTEFWLGYWGGNAAFVGAEYRAGQFYGVDTLVLVSGKPKPLASAVPTTSPAKPLSERIGTFSAYPAILGQPSGCDATFFRPSASITSPRHLAAITGTIPLPIYLATNMASETRTVAAIRLDDRDVLLDMTGQTQWRGNGISIRYQNTDSYSPGNYGVGYGAGQLIVEANGETAQFRVLSLSVC